MNAIAIDPRKRTALLAGLIVVAMLALGYASVPLYRMFCEATGLDGTTQRAKYAPGGLFGKRIEIRFDANHVPSIPWRFEPEVKSDTVTIGARDIAYFTATNNGDRPVTGRALFNVQPSAAGAYFNKIQCFCFTEQTLQPGQTIRMPVVYYVDPKILDDPDARDIQAITLSYTFYPVDEAKKPS